MNSLRHVVAVVMVLGSLMGAVAVAVVLLRPPKPPEPPDPNVLAPHDAIDSDDPDLPYGWSGP